MISLSISIINTFRDNRPASQAFTINHSCHIQIYHTKSLLNLFCILIQHKLLRMHFEAFQSCCPEPERTSARALALEASLSSGVATGGAGGAILALKKYNFSFVAINAKHEFPYIFI